MDNTISSFVRHHHKVNFIMVKNLRLKISFFFLSFVCINVLSEVFELFYSK